MIYAVYAVAGLVIGAIAGWLIASARAAAVRARENSELNAKAESSQGRLEEVRGQLDEKESEIENLRKELDTERSARTAFEARLEEERKNLQEQRRLIEESQKKLSDTFDALAGKALKSSGDEFLKLAKETLATILETTKGDLGKRIEPLRTTLESYEKHVLEMEKSLKSDYGKVDDQIKVLAGEARKLADALSKPQVRGQWGELTLRNAVEAAGMSKYCDFEEQATAESRDERTIRPDMKINVPGNHFILVDSKVPRDDYVRAVETQDDSEKEEALKQHAKKVRDHMKALARKEYWKQEGSMDFVVMFLPAESFFSAALMYDVNLIEDGTKQNVILASPINLIALLRATALTWQQSKIAENAQKIAEEGRKLFERVQTFGSHFSGIGSSLEKARDAFNKAVGSWNNRVRQSGERLVKLGTVPASSELEEIGMIEKPIREIPAEFNQEED
jgi:DNA recombination protein RmuC